METEVRVEIPESKKGYWTYTVTPAPKTVYREYVQQLMRAASLGDWRKYWQLAGQAH